jgi:hypothetical protein
MKTKPLSRFKNNEFDPLDLLPRVTIQSSKVAGNEVQQFFFPPAIRDLDAKHAIGKIAGGGPLCYA